MFLGKQFCLTNSHNFIVLLLFVDLNKGYFLLKIMNLWSKFSNEGLSQSRESLLDSLLLTQ